MTVEERFAEWWFKQGWDGKALNAVESCVSSKLAYAAGHAAALEWAAEEARKAAKHWHPLVETVCGVLADRIAGGLSGPGEA